MFARLSVFVVAVLGCLVFIATGGAAERPPNIVFIMADDK